MDAMIEIDTRRKLAAPRLLYTADGGHECDLATTPGGWVLGVVTVADVDSGFVRNMDQDTEWEHAKALLYPGKTYEEWSKAFMALRPRLELLESDGGAVRLLHSEKAEQFSGIAAVGGTDPAFIWTALDDGRWTVNLHTRRGTETLYSGSEIVQTPSLARDSDGALLCAWVRRDGSGDWVHVTDESGRTVAKVEGRFPSLAPAGGGFAVAYEVFRDGESHIAATAVGSPGAGAIRLSSGDPLNFRPRAIAADDGTVLVTWESSPAWGFDVRVDQVRRLWLRRADMESGAVSDGPGTGPGGLLPVGLRSFSRSGDHSSAINMTPSNPRVIATDSGLACAFRMFQPDMDPKVNVPWIVDGRFNRDRQLYHQREGWYLAMTHLDGGQWTEPVRVTEPVGFSHHVYGLDAYNGGVLAAGHCFDVEQVPSRSHRVEVVSVPLRERGLNGGTVAGLPRMHEGIHTLDAVELMPANPPTHAPPLSAAPEGYELVFGDLHDHTSHSSCSPVRDGDPIDNMRLQRDVLGYRVLCIADHQRISDADYLQRLDLLEREGTPGYVPLYAIEWNKQPWQHINFYTYDREVMKELRIILLRDLDIHLMFNDIYDRFPDMVMANRHFHDYGKLGGHGIVGDTHTHLYDPRVEWAMEALHSRGDMLATEEGMFGGPSDFPFPINFIEWKNARLGFIGGTDHHMRTLGACSTGFFTKEMTGKAIFEALRERRTYACAGGELGLWVTAGGVPMGQEGEASTPVEVSVSVSAPLPVETVSLWSDGGYIQHRKVNERQAVITFIDERREPGERYYIVRVQTQQTPEYPKGPILGYSSPIYVTAR